jgi:hypothetical protein
MSMSSPERDAPLLPESGHAVELQELTIDTVQDRGCTIDKVEHRGISLRQLHDLVEEMRELCAAKTWIRPARTNSNGETVSQAMTLEAHTVNLYDLVDKIVKPRTKERKCSYVELVATGPQKPDYFISHWWGEPVEQVVACVETHAKDHGLDEDTVYYWVCAYANRQHDIEKEMGEGIADSPFKLALEACDYKVVSIVDPQAECFKRAWCALEINEAWTVEHVSWSVYTAARPGDKCKAYTTRCKPWQKTKAYFNALLEHIPDLLYYGGSLQLLNRFPTTVQRMRARRHELIIPHIETEDRDAVGIAHLPDEPTFARAKRFADFPIELFAKALEIDVVKCEASRDNDKKMILRHISLCDGDGDPPMTDQRYDAFNAKIRGVFARAAWRVVLEKQPKQDKRLTAELIEKLADSRVNAGRVVLEVPTRFDELMERLTVALANSKLKNIVLTFEGVEQFDDDAARLLVQALPSSLEYLKLTLGRPGSRGCSLTQQGVIDFCAGLFAEKRLPNLIVLDLDVGIHHEALESLLEGMEGNQVLQQMESLRFAPGSISDENTTGQSKTCLETCVSARNMWNAMKSACLETHIFWAKLKAAGCTKLEHLDVSGNRNLSVSWCEERRISAKLPAANNVRWGYGRAEIILIKVAIFSFFYLAYALASAEIRGTADLWILFPAYIKSFSTIHGWCHETLPLISTIAPDLHTSRACFAYIMSCTPELALTIFCSLACTLAIVASLSTLRRFAFALFAFSAHVTFWNSAPSRIFFHYAMFPANMTSGSMEQALQYLATIPNVTLESPINGSQYAKDSLTGQRLFVPPLNLFKPLPSSMLVGNILVSLYLILSGIARRYEPPHWKPLRIGISIPIRFICGSVLCSLLISLAHFFVSRFISNDVAPCAGCQHEPFVDQTFWLHTWLSTTSFFFLVECAIIIHILYRILQRRRRRLNSEV